MRGRWTNVLNDSYEKGSLWTAAGFQGFVDWPLTSWLAARVDLGALVPFQRPRFLVLEGEVRSAHHVSAVAFRTQIGAEFRY
jgi:hypothetical protein